MYFRAPEYVTGCGRFLWRCVRQCIVVKRSNRQCIAAEQIHHQCIVAEQNHCWCVASNWSHHQCIDAKRSNLWCIVVERSNCWCIAAEQSHRQWIAAKRCNWCSIVVDQSNHWRIVAVQSRWSTYSLSFTSLLFLLVGDMLIVQSEQAWIMKMSAIAEESHNNQPNTEVKWQRDWDQSKLIESQSMACINRQFKTTKERDTTINFKIWNKLA